MTSQDTPLTELLPCPFCGGEAKYHEGALSNRAGCVSCNFFFFAQNDACIAAWNRRLRSRQTEQAEDGRLIAGGTASSSELFIELGMNADDAKRHETRLENIAGNKPRLAPAPERPAGGMPEEPKVWFSNLVGWTKIQTDSDPGDGWVTKRDYDALRAVAEELMRELTATRKQRGDQFFQIGEMTQRIDELRQRASNPPSAAAPVRDDI